MTKDSATVRHSSHFATVVVRTVALGGRSVLRTSVAKGPKFRPQNSKGALQKCVAGKIGGRIFFKYAKKGAKRGRTFLKMIIHIKTFKYLQKSTLHLLMSLIFHSLC
jgi:hypothetical protein